VKPAAPKAKRFAAERRGRRAEWVAAFYLMAKGYRILGQRVRTPFGEVDLAAWKGRRLIVIEVKARRTVADGVIAVTAEQKRRLVRAGECLAGRWRMAGASIRFDIVVVAGWRVLAHRRGAFDAGD
jgi:putative endonuclease